MREKASASGQCPVPNMKLLSLGQSCSSFLWASGRGVPCSNETVIHTAMRRLSRHAFAGHGFGARVLSYSNQDPLARMLLIT